MIGDFEDFDLNGVADGGEGVAVAKDEGDEAGALAGGGEGVAVHGGVGIADGGQGVIADVFVLEEVGLEDAELGFFGDEGLHAGGEAVDGGGPFGPVGVVGGEEAFEEGDVSGGEQVEVEVVLSGDFVVEDAFEDEGAFGAAQGIEEKSLLQVRGEELEVGFALVAAGFEGGGKAREADGGVVEGDGFFAGGVVQGDAIFGEAVGGVGGEGLLIEDLGAGLAADLGEAEFGES